MENSVSIKCLSVGQGARQGKTIGAKEWGRGKAVQDNWGREVGKEQDRASQMAQGHWRKGVRKGQGNWDRKVGKDPEGGYPDPPSRSAP